MANRRRIKIIYIALFAVLLCTLMGASAQIMLKTGLNKIGSLSIKDMAGPKIFNVVFQPFIFFGIALYALSMIVWLYALSNYDVSFVFPLISLSYVFNALLATVFLNETIPPMRWLAIIIIVSGCFMITKT